jgi:hypothetical protein
VSEPGTIISRNWFIDLHWTSCTERPWQIHRSRCWQTTKPCRAGQTLKCRKRSREQHHRPVVCMLSITTSVWTHALSKFYSPCINSNSNDAGHIIHVGIRGHHGVFITSGYSIKDDSEGRVIFCSPAIPMPVDPYLLKKSPDHIIENVREKGLYYAACNE